MTEFFDVGDTARLKATFTDIDNNPLDPSTVTFIIVDGAGSQTTYVYGTDSEVVKSGTGVYYVDWLVAVHGVHNWRFESSGTGQAAQEGIFTATGFQTAVEPVTIGEAKAHLHVDDDDPHLTYLANYIVAARQSVEEYLNVTIVNRSRSLVLDAFPSGSYQAITLPNGPVLSVSSIAYVDTDGANQTVGSFNSVSYSHRDVVSPVFGESWPSTRDQLGAVTITYTCGMMTGSPLLLSNRDIKAAILLTLGDLWENREAQIIGTTINVNRTVDRLLHFYRRSLGV